MVGFSLVLCFAALLMPSVGDTANVVSEEHMGLLHTLQTDTTHYQIP